MLVAAWRANDLFRVLLEIFCKIQPLGSLVKERTVYVSSFFLEMLVMAILNLRKTISAFRSINGQLNISTNNNHNRRTDEVQLWY